MIEDSKNQDELIDPDPLSVLIIALGAVGSVASIYAVVDDKYLSKKRENHRANCHAIKDSIMAIETSVNELRSYLKSLEILFMSSAQGRSKNNDRNPLMSMAKFGSVKLLFTKTGHDRWREIEHGVIESATRVTKNVNELVRHFSMTPISFNGEIVERLQGAVNTMNQCIGGISQMHFERLFGEMDRVTTECMDAMSRLRMAVYENCH